jgi:hypothetical protein
MPVAARLVLPGRAPEDPGQREDGIAAAERAADVVVLEPPQTEFTGVEVEESVRGRDVDLDGVERAGARVGAELVPAPPADDAGAEPEQPVDVGRERLERDPRVLLVRDGLVRPVEPARAAADALMRVLRPLVVAARSLCVPVARYEDLAR